MIRHHSLDWVRLHIAPKNECTVQSFQRWLSLTSDSASGNTFQVLFLSHPAKQMENKKFGGLTSTVAIPMNLQILWKLCLWLGTSHRLRFWGFYQLWFQVWAHKRSASFRRPQGLLDQTARTSSKSPSWGYFDDGLGGKMFKKYTSMYR